MASSLVVIAVQIALASVAAAAVTPMLLWLQSCLQSKTLVSVESKTFSPVRCTFTLAQ